ncbi:MAG: acetate--CoA ligase family protein [Actinobacteria bacterium]|nr:acetate--CoA ligase family protein [Actinomycetota bacterium]
MSDIVGDNPALEVIEAARSAGRRSLSEHESKAVLQAYGIPVTREELVADGDGLPAALCTFDLPVVLKIDSPDILHKTEAGLVALGCTTTAETETAFRRIMDDARANYPGASINGVLIQEMVTGTVAECIVGMKKDPQFGPTILFGLGGIFVEVFGDVALRVAPVSEADVRDMVQEIKAYKILTGARGRPKADIPAIEDTLLKMSRLALELEPYLVEIDINPFMVGCEDCGAKAADALIVLEAK